ncbi:MAG: PD-(D/E)XK nuclease family protein, partial [bacterium]
DIRAGISLQLPLYLYSMETLLAEQRGLHVTPAGGMYYQVRHPVALKVGVGSASHKDDIAETNSNANLLGSDGELRTLINETITRINAFVDDMTKGKFPLTTPDKVEKVCVYCDYKTICRIQTLRSVRQSPQEGS